MKFPSPVEEVAVTVNEQPSPLVLRATEENLALVMLVASPQEIV